MKELKNIINLYLKDKEVCSKTTLDSYNYSLQGFYNFLTEKNYTFADVEKTETLIDYRNYLMQNKNIKDNTTLYYLNNLSLFFKWGIKQKHFKNNPVSQIEKPKHKAVELENLLDIDDIETLLKGAIPRNQKKALRNKTIIMLVCESGIRTTELLNLTIKDLDFERQTIHIINGKGNKNRYTTFPKDIQHLMKLFLDTIPEKYRTDPNFKIFGSIVSKNGIAKEYSRQNLYVMVRNYVYRATGKKLIGTHDLRHAYASYLLTNNVSMLDIQNLLGHSSLKTTQIYATRLNPERIPQDVSNVFNMGRC